MADGRLLPLLEARRVIPIIGQDSLTVEIDGHRVPLYQHFARQRV